MSDHRPIINVMYKGKRCNHDHRTINDAIHCRRLKLRERRDPVDPHYVTLETLIWNEKRHRYESQKTSQQAGHSLRIR